jgi:hypothetical protein
MTVTKYFKKTTLMTTQSMLGKSIGEKRQINSTLILKAATKI